MENNDTKVTIEAQEYNLRIPSFSKMEEEKALEYAEEHAREKIAIIIGEKIRTTFIKRNKETIDKHVDKYIEEKREAILESVYEDIDHWDS